MDTLSLSCVQYLFSKGEHEVKPAPHRNAKHSESYMRTMPSTMSKLKASASSSTAKKALAFVSEGEGGIERAKSGGSLPRSRQQINDIRRKLGGPSDTDPILSLMLMCKESQGHRSGSPFVRLVNGAPFPMMVLSYDWTLDDIERFCIGSKEYSILGVDPTFSLGDFDVTVTTYHHLLLRHRGELYGRSPCLIGPLFVHLKKDFAAYHFFASALISLRPPLCKLKCFGSDGEDALVKAFCTAFPNAIHLRCFLHFRGNVEEKLRQLRIPSLAAKDIVRDILGNPACLQTGLVDARDESELDSMLTSLKLVWNEREKLYNSPPQFHAWFVQHCRQTVAENMLRPVREKALLGSPPRPYYTNEVESKNNVLKQQLQYKAAQLPQFVEHMKSLLLGQKREVERAVATTGEYRVSPEYSHLAVSTQKWFTLNEQQRQRCINKFTKAEVVTNLPLQGTENNPVPPQANMTSGDDEESQEEGRPANTNPFSSLCLPTDVKNTLWSRGQALAQDETSMVRSPGSTTDWIVQSLTGKQPHFVKPSSKGGIACDTNCLAYKSMRLCSHTVAVAVKTDSVQQLVGWHKRSKFAPNLTCIAEEGKPSGVGKKGGNRKASSKATTKRIRKIVSQADEEDYSQRVMVPQSSATLTGVTTGRCSQVHIDRMKQSLKVVTTSPMLASAHTPVSAHRWQGSTSTGTCWSDVHVQSGDHPLPVQAGSTSSYITPSVFTEPGPATHISGTAMTQMDKASMAFCGAPSISFPPMQPVTGYTPPGVDPRMHQWTVVPSQIIAGTTPALPTGYQLPRQLSLGSPPPLISVATCSSRPAVGEPFAVCFVHGNISRCNGCKGRICRGEDKKPLPPPGDIVLRHSENVVFQNPNTGVFQQSRSPRNVYYHLQRTCVAPHFLDFNPMQHIVVNAAISNRLTQEHKLLLKDEFGLDLK